MLSTAKPILGKTKDDTRQMTSLYKVYYFTKGKTDIVDQRMGFHMVKTKSKKWTMVALAYILDMARVNSDTMYALNSDIDPCNVRSFEFAFDLVRALLKPQIELRNQHNLKWITRNKIQMIIGKTARPSPLNELGPPISEKRMRCHMCMLEIVVKGKRVNKDHVNSLKSLCQLCGKYKPKPSDAEMCRMPVIIQGNVLSFDHPL